MKKWNNQLPEPKGIEKKMVDMLRNIWDNDEFIFCSRVMIKTDAERKEIVTAIQNGEIETSSDMCLYAVQISKDRENGK